MRLLEKYRKDPVSGGPFVPKQKPKSGDYSKPVKLYVAIRSCRFRFGDETTHLLERGVSPQVTEAQMKELVKSKLVEEVK